MKFVNGLIFLFTMVLILNGHSDSTASNRVQFTAVNPIYQHLSKQSSTDSSRRVSAYSLPVECNSYSELKSTLKDFYTSRTRNFSIRIYYDFFFNELSAQLKTINDEIMANDDYLNLSYERYQYDYNGYDGDVTIKYNVEYLTTYDEENDITQMVDEILSGIISQDMDNGQKVKTIHDWIVLNLEYDTSGTNFSAYEALFDGKAVCQGYALLSYKMLQKAGIKVRIVTSDAMNHAWNLVYLCKNWYHMDATWDDPSPDQPGIVYDDYYMKSDDEFRNHDIQDHTWITGSYPPAPQAYQGDICYLTQTQVSQLYVSIFGRASEGNGNNFWMGTTDTSEEPVMQVAARSMLDSQAAKKYFGPALDSNQAFIEHIYLNTLGKDYEDDPNGINFWVAALNGGMSKGEIITSLINATQNPKCAGAAQDLFNNKVTVSNYTSNTIDTVPGADLSPFIECISLLSDDPATVTAAKAAVDVLKKKL